MSIAAGTIVRLRTDPGRTGVLTGRDQGGGSDRYLQVSFPEGASWVPEDELEVVPEAGDEPIDLLRRGRLARPSDLYRTLTHIRLSGRLANFIYSLETTGTDFYAYQFKPVLKLLQSVSTGILVADEVGLGKTIEAGLIWTELRSRFDLQRILVVCPAMLRQKWVRELRKRFGVKAEIGGAEELVARLRAIASGEETELAMVASVQGLRPPQGWEDDEAASLTRAGLARSLVEAAEDEPLIDLLVVDEAHHLRNPETSTAELGRLLRRVAQYAVLLSATPVHLRSEDLFNLLRIVDEDAFSRPDVFEMIRGANEHLVTARDRVLAGKVDPAALRRDLERALQLPLLAGNRQLQGLMEDLEKANTSFEETRSRVAVAARLEQANLLGFAVTRTRRREVKEWRAVRSPLTLRVQMSETESRFYELVTAVVVDYCQQRDAHEGFLLVTPQRQVSSCMAAAMLHWLQDRPELAEELYQDLGIEVPDPDPASLGPVVQALRAAVESLGRVTDLAAKDTKYEKLLGQLRPFLSENPGEKVVIFSSFRATLRYLASRLRKDGIGSALLIGGDPDGDQVLASFADEAGPSILLSSEVGSEGIDLQFAWVLVNYDLPWNPMRVEQRIGRLDRLGQKSDRVVIWNLLHEGTIDERIYDRLLERLGVFERTLGGLEAVLGEQIRDLTWALFSRQLTPEEQENRIDQTAVAIENRRALEEDLEAQATSLVAYGDYIVQQVQAARDLSRRLRADDLRRYVLDHLRQNYPGCRIEEDVTDPSVVHIELSVQARNELADFLRERRTPTALTRGAALVRCRFENQVQARTTPGEEVVNQLHPLVRFVAASETRGKMAARPAIAAKLVVASAPEGVARGDYRIAVCRWSFDALRPTEQLWFGVDPLDGSATLTDDDAERFVMAVAEAGGDWPGATMAVDLPALAHGLEDALARNWAAHRARVAEIRAQNEDLADAQLRSLETHRSQQLEKYEQQLRLHRSHGNLGLERATLKNIERLKARVAQQVERITYRRGVGASMDQICVGVVRVE